MAKKYLKVQVTKKLSTDVYVEVDEEDERFKGLIEAQAKGDHKLMYASGWKAESALHPHVQKAVEETITSMDWEEDSEYEVDTVNVCTKKEATQYNVFQMPSPSKKPSQ